MLDAPQRQTFDYFIRDVNPTNGLMRDKTQSGAAASIATVGLALAAYPTRCKSFASNSGSSCGRAT
jgi:hypothetical protein